MKERLLLDMDGCITDTMGAVFERLEARGQASLIHADIKDYWFTGMGIDPNIILDIMREPGFYTDLQVITGAVGAINRLRETFDTVICTSPLKGAVTCAEEKYEWIKRVFDKDFADSALIVPDKTPVHGRVLVEDNPHIDPTHANWQPLMFDQAWNIHADYPRMFGWHDLEPIKELMT